MSEYVIGYLAVAGLVGVVIACLLWMIGGRANKIIRRLGGALVLAVTVCGLSMAMGVFHIYQTAILLTLFAGFSLGYGGHNLGQKLMRRSIFCVAVCASGLIMAWTIGGNAWMIVPLHFGVGAWSVWMGVNNPIYAASEEVFVCALLNLGLAMYPFSVAI